MLRDILNIIKSIISVLGYFCKMGYYLLVIGGIEFQEKRNAWRAKQGLEPITKETWKR